MRAWVLHLAVAVALFMPWTAARALAGDAPSAGAVVAVGEKLFPETGRVGSGTAVAVVPLPSSGSPGVDLGTQRQVDALWARLRREGMHPEGPPLLGIVAVPVVRPTWPATEVGGAAESPSVDPITVFSNTSPNSVVPATYSSTVNEPAAAIRGNRIFYSMNWWAASSATGGASYTSVNPFTGPSPPVDGGFCCDQQVIYDRRTNTLFYLQQYINSATTGTQRINVDVGFDGTFDCYFDFTPQSFAFPANNWADFPDLALDNGYLVHSSNVYSTATNAFTGAVVARYPLAQMVACGAVSYGYFTSPSLGSFRIAQGGTDTIYFAAHMTNASLRLYSWQDGSPTVNSFDRTVNAWPVATATCPNPDARDWCGFVDGRMSGGFAYNGIVGFMWGVAQGGGLTAPNIRVARFDRLSGLALVDQPMVYNPSTAFLYPSAAVNDAGEVGGTFLWGNASTYMSCGAFLADRANSWVMAPLENAFVSAGVIGPGSNRSGDYLTTRHNYPRQSSFAGTCFDFVTTTSSDSRLALFSRSSLQLALFRNSFETGDTLVWSAVVP